MHRRKLLSGLGAGTVGLLTIAGNVEAQEPDRFRYRSRLDKTHVDCLDACTACAAVCNEAASHCLAQVQKGSTDKEHHAHAHHVTMDCAEVCALSAALVARQSMLMDLTCNACAEACRRCALECSKGQEDAEIMQDCARIWRECEKTCHAMLKAMGIQSGGAR
jgi:hypothetical protein